MECNELDGDTDMGVVDLDARWAASHAVRSSLGRSPPKARLEHSAALAEQAVCRAPRVRDVPLYTAGESAEERVALARPEPECAGG